MALAPLLYNITFDSQTRILYFWDKAGHEIYHCEIPSPAPALPTVRLIGDSNYNYWLYVGSTVNQSSTLANNATAPLYSVPGSSFPGWTVYPKATVGYYNKQGDYYTLVGRVGLEPEEVVHPVYGVRVFGCRNISGSSITFVRARIAQCDSTDATVITVYDSSNNPYNAFQYTSDGTDYYYVLDGVQTDWTDDLSGIGYRLQQIYTGWCKSDHSNMNFSLWNECNLLDNSGNEITRASGKGNPTIYKLYNSNGDEVSASFTIQWNDPYYTGTYKLMIKCYDGNSPSIAKVDYKLG